MARRRKRKHQHHSYVKKTPVSKKIENKQQKSNASFFPVLLLLGFVFMGFYFFYNKQSSAPSNDKPLTQQETTFTINERIKIKNADIKMEQEIKLQNTLSEKLEKPVEKIDPLESEVSALDMGVRFPNNISMETVFEDLNEKPFENDKYEDPEDIIRRQVAHQEWLEKYLQERNEREKEEFISWFVKKAEEQGYRVHFGEGTKVLLEPIKFDKKKTEKSNFKEVKINWK